MFALLATQVISWHKGDKSQPKFQHRLEVDYGPKSNPDHQLYGNSSIGRARALGARGRRFDSCFPYYAMLSAFFADRFGLRNRPKEFNRILQGGKDMLILSRYPNESVIIDGDVEVKIVDVRGDKVRLGIDAPKHIPVHRKEVQDAIDSESNIAVGLTSES